MITLFDQEYAMKAYVAEEKRNSEIKGAVGMAQDFGCTIEETINKVVAMYNLPEDDAKEYVEEYWKVAM